MALKGVLHIKCYLKYKFCPSYYILSWSILKPGKLGYTLFFQMVGGFHLPFYMLKIIVLILTVFAKTFARTYTEVITSSSMAQYILSLLYLDAIHSNGNDLKFLLEAWFSIMFMVRYFLFVSFLIQDYGIQNLNQATNIPIEAQSLTLDYFSFFSTMLRYLFGGTSTVRIKVKLSCNL